MSRVAAARRLGEGEESGQSDGQEQEVQDLHRGEAVGAVS